jgi:hypothetical protein
MMKQSEIKEVMWHPVVRTLSVRWMVNQSQGG